MRNFIHVEMYYNQKLTHSSRVFKRNQGSVVFIWNSDKRTHSLTMKRNE